MDFKAQEPASPETEEHATERAVLQLNAPVLIGTFGAETEPRALLHYPGGRIETLAPGDETRLGRVAAISAEAVYLMRGGRERVLRMPDAA